MKIAQVGIQMDMKYENVTSGDFIPSIRNMRFQNVSFAALTKAPVYIMGLTDSAKITGVTIADCTFPEVRNGSVIRFADNILVIDTPGLK